MTPFRPKSNGVSRRFLILLLVSLRHSVVARDSESSDRFSCDGETTAGGALVQTSSAHLQRAVGPADEGGASSTPKNEGQPTDSQAVGDAKVARQEVIGHKAVNSTQSEATLQGPAPDSRRANNVLSQYRSALGHPLALLQLFKEHTGRSQAAGLAVALALIILLVVAVALAAVLTLAPKKPSRDGQQALTEQRFPSPGPASVRGQKPVQSEAGQSAYSQEGSSAASWGAAHHFCPELVVPLGHEAVLAVPLDQSRKFQVKDLEGKAVLAAEVMPRAAAQDAIVRLTAFPAPGGAPQGAQLAHCKMLRSASDGHNTIEVFNARNERFASITRITNAALLQALPQGKGLSYAYMLAPMSDAGGGIYLLVGGDFRRRTLSIVNERKDVLADTETAPMPFDQRNAYFKLRVASGADVGLILCALLSIQILEHST